VNLPKFLTNVTSFSKILTAVLFISFPFLGFYLGLKYEEQFTQYLESPANVDQYILTNQPTATKDPSTANPDSIGANWKTYRNEEFGFEVKYPNAWMIESPYAGPDPTGYDFAVQISNVKNPFGIRCGETERETGVNPCASNQVIYILVTDLSLRKMMFQDVIRSSGKSDEQKVVEINELTFVKVGESSPMYFIQKGNVVYSFNAIGNIVIFDQILSTFRFIE